MEIGWIAIVLLPPSYCLYRSVSPDLPHSLESLFKPSKHGLPAVLYTLKGSVKFASMISQDAKEAMK
eukprot:12951534-Ditylum_brightwellii.AAC.1